MQAETPSPRAPAGLSARARRLHKAVVEGYDLSAAELELLAEGLRALDRADGARAVVDREGMSVPDRYGSPKAHPLLDVEHRSRSLYASVVRQLGVVEAVEKGGR